MQALVCFPKICQSSCKCEKGKGSCGTIRGEEQGQTYSSSARRASCSISTTSALSRRGDMLRVWEALRSADIGSLCVPTVEAEWLSIERRAVTCAADIVVFCLCPRAVRGLWWLAG